MSVLHIGGLLALAFSSTVTLASTIGKDKGSKPAPLQIACPARLPADVAVTKQRPDGWTVGLESEAVLDERGVLTGAPNEQAYLMPDRPGEKRGSESWSFDTPHAIEHSVYCRYGPVVLAKRLPADIRQCTETVSKERSWPVFVCR